MSRTVEVSWQSSAGASFAWALDSARRSRAFADPTLASLVAPAAAEITQLLDRYGCRPEQFFEHLIPLAARNRIDEPLLARAIQKALGQHDSLTRKLAETVLPAHEAFFQRLSQADQELSVRVGPLREQWEARGPGVLYMVANLTTAHVLPSRAEVTVILPLMGGGGAAFPVYNLACIEGVLANPRPELPEIVRLGWLIAQLNAEMPAFEGTRTRPRTIALMRLALVPIVLAAAEEVELVRCDSPTLAAALEYWKVTIDGKACDLATLWSWWLAFRDTPLPPDDVAAAEPDGRSAEDDTVERSKLHRWNVAIDALDQMLR